MKNVWEHYIMTLPLTTKNYAAGILPVTWVNNEALFLVGKDIRDGTYSDFGGKRERYDRNELATASREFYEETLGIIVGQKQILSRLTPETSIVVNGQTQNGNAYYMYIVEIPFFPHARAMFRKVAEFLRSKNVNRLYVEKLDVQWATMDMLNSMTKRKVFANTLDMNKTIIQRIGASTPGMWRDLCMEYSA